MDNILRDPIWQFMGVFTAIVLFMISFWLTRRTTKRVIEYRLSLIPIAHIHDLLHEAIWIGYEERNKYKFTFDGTAIYKLDVVKVEIKNVGTKTIVINNLILRYNTQGEVLNATVEEMFPANLNATCTKQANEVIVAIGRLNKGEHITVTALVKDYRNVRVDTALENVEITEYVADPKTRVTAPILMGITWVWLYLSGLIGLLIFDNAWRSWAEKGMSLDTIAYSLYIGYLVVSAMIGLKWISSRLELIL